MTTERPARRFPLALGRLSGAAAEEQSRGQTAPRAAASGLIRPQRHVAAAHEDAARARPAVGLGLDSADVRARMVDRLRRDGVGHPRVLAAFAAVPRHVFVDAALATQAYEDTSLPIGHGQTISKPSVVARMLELLAGGVNAQAAGDLGAVLEIGTGCGYQAALLCRMARRVISVERLKPLHDKARELLAPMRETRLRLVFGDGMLGHPPSAPYDSIVAAAGGSEIPQAWLDQLAVGGRLVSPVQRADGRGQVLVVVDRRADGYERSLHEAVRFVPLKSGLAR
ncbi:MAG TPA: protein-L-isoaspartate(D-aspartate) O-methyltransferase [Caldimonas sp.]|jgi:protein-L-isoaspartate(D-aspartate) O-methyltransferase